MYSDLNLRQFIGYEFREEAVPFIGSHGSGRSCADFITQLISSVLLKWTPKAYIICRTASRGIPSTPSACDRMDDVTRCKSSLYPRKTCGSRIFSVPCSYVERADTVNWCAIRANKTVFALGDSASKSIGSDSAFTSAYGAMCSYQLCVVQGLAFSFC